MHIEVVIERLTKLQSGERMIEPRSEVQRSRERERKRERERQDTGERGKEGIAVPCQRFAC